jgi:outer membrane protein assembly factor BamA
VCTAGFDRVDVRDLPCGERGAAVAASQLMRVVWMLVVVATSIVAGLVEPRAEAVVVVPVTPAPAHVVKGVALDGQGATLPEAELRRLVATQVGAAVDPGLLDLDREAIAQTLVARGYLAATTTATVTNTAGGAYVVFDVATGPLYRVRSVAITGPAQSLEASLQSTIGEDASDERIAQVRRAVVDSLAGRTGKIAVDLAVIADAATASVDLEVSTRITTLARR